MRCGEWDTQQEIEPLPHQDRDVHSVFWHPAFDSSSLSNDLALLSLDSPFSLADNVVPVCLPDQTGQYVQYDKAGCVATGWGKDQWGQFESFK